MTMLAQAPAPDNITGPAAAAVLAVHWTELAAREQRILLLRYYGNLAQAQIGEQLGLSQMHVSRLISQSLAYLRDRMLGSEPQRTLIGGP